MWFALFLFFKRKTAYEVRISDWSSDVCSPDLRRAHCVLMPSDGLAQFPALADRHGEKGVMGDEDARLFRRDRREAGAKHVHLEIGRASCRERVCQYV